MSTPVYLSHNKAMDAAEIRSSGDAGPVRGPIHSTQRGSARLGIDGAYNRDIYTEFVLRCTAVGADGQTPMATVPVASGANAGDGIATVSVGATNTTSGAFVATCTQAAGSNTPATAQDQDYTDLFAAGLMQGISVQARPAYPGADGNGITVSITASEAPSLALVWTDTGLTVSNDVEAPIGSRVAESTQVPVDGEVSVLANGDMICFSGSQPGTDEVGDYGAYAVVSRVTGSFKMMRSAREKIPEGMSVYKLTSGGFRVTIGKPGFPDEIVDRVGSTPRAIRTACDVLEAVNNGGQRWSTAGAGSWVSTTSTLAIWANGSGGAFPPLLSSITTAGGATNENEGAIATFRVEYSGATTADVAEGVPADGSTHALAGYGFHAANDMTVRFTPGSAPFSTGDVFTWTTASSSFELSTDNGITFAGTFWASESGTTLLHGIGMLWDIGSGSIPWVVGDEYAFRYDYTYTAQNLKYAAREEVWRTINSFLLHQATFCFDAPTIAASVFVLDQLAGQDVILHGSDIEPFGTITGMGIDGDPNIQDANWMSGHGPDGEFTSGYLIMASGAARGLGWVISDSSTDGIFTLQPNGSGLQPEDEGAQVGDRFVLVNASPEFSKDLTTTDGSNCGALFSEVPFRFWSLVVAAIDGGPAEGYFEVGSLYFGTPVSPSTGFYNLDDHVLPVFELNIKDGRRGRRMIERQGVSLRYHITHDYTGDGAGISQADYSLLFGLVTDAVVHDYQIVLPTVIVEDSALPSAFYLGSMQSPEQLGKIRHNAWGAILKWESVERAGS